MSVEPTSSPLGRPLTRADVMTAGEVADLLSIQRSTVEDWARRAVIPSRKIGRRRFYLRLQIEALLLDGISSAPVRRGPASG